MSDIRKEQLIEDQPIQFSIEGTKNIISNGKLYMQNISRKWKKRKWIFLQNSI